MPLFHQMVLWGASATAIGATSLVIFTSNPVYAVLYLVLSLFSVSLIFWALGAVFLAVLEILVYAGAIMVLFLFVVMMLNLGHGADNADTKRPSSRMLLLPAAFAALLGALTLFAIIASVPPNQAGHVVLGAKEIGQVLFTRHYLGVELVSLILTIGMVGGMHLGRAMTLAEDDHEYDLVGTKPNDAKIHSVGETV